MATIQKVMEGLQILAKYDAGGEMAAEHDIIYAGNAEVSEEDAKKLEELGWHKDGEYDCWARFT